jgi:hypothetical protein
LGPPDATYPEPHSQSLEEFFATLRFEQRDQLLDFPVTS